MKNNKSQTATEYLVILAVVVVIALIVVGVMGGIPSIGGGASEQTVRAQLRTMDVGIQNYMINSKYTLLKVQNNNPSSITITDMTVNGIRCSFRDTTLRGGETKDIGCYGVKSYDDGTKFQYPITITYTDSATNAEYVINDSNVPLVGTIAGGSELHTGQQTCYVGDSTTVQPCSNAAAIGQDGAVDGTAKSFSQITDGTIQDLHTGLYWSNASASTGAKATAQTYCDGLNSAEQGGFSDWRVPNIIELTTVLGSSTDMDSTSNPSPNGDFWLSGGSGNIWSSTANADDQQYFVTLSSDSSDPYTQGYFDISRESNSYSVCVRGSVSGISLSDTDKNFVDNGDGTITDVNAGIVWQKGDSGSTMYWNDSVEYCKDLVLAGKSDWRLPTVSEGVQMIDYSKSDSAAYDYYPDAFGALTFFEYWTGTTYPESTGWAYFLGLDSGYVSITFKQFDTFHLRAKCVRNGFIE